MSEIRNPYVGSGVDGALRSASIDEREADTLELSDPRRAQVLDSARRWREQAYLLWCTHPESVANELIAAALRYDNDAQFRAQVDGTEVHPDEVDWGAVQAAFKDGLPTPEGDQ